MSSPKEAISPQELSALVADVHRMELRLARLCFGDAGQVLTAVRGYRVAAGKLSEIIQVDIQGLSNSDIPQVVNDLLQHVPIAAVTSEAWVTRGPLDRSEKPNKSGQADQAQGDGVQAKPVHGHRDEMGREEVVTVMVHTREGTWSALHPIARSVQELPERLRVSGGSEASSSPSLPMILDAELERPTYSGGRMVELNLSQIQEQQVRRALRELLAPGGRMDVASHGDGTTGQPGVFSNLQGQAVAPEWEAAIPLLVCRVAEELHDVAPVVREAMAADVLSERKALCDRVMECIVTTAAAASELRRAEDGTVRRVAASEASSASAARLEEEALLALTFSMEPLTRGKKLPDLSKATETVNRCLRRELLRDGLLVAAAPDGEIFVVGEYLLPDMAQHLLFLSQSWLGAQDGGEPGVASDAQSAAEIAEIYAALRDRAQREEALSRQFRAKFGTSLTVPLVAHYLAPARPSVLRLMTGAIAPNLVQMMPLIRQASERAMRVASEELGLSLHVSGMGPFYEELRRKYAAAHDATLSMLVSEVCRRAAAQDIQLTPGDLQIRLEALPSPDDSPLEPVNVVIQFQGDTVTTAGVRRTPFLNMQDFLQGTIDALGRNGVRAIEIVRKDLEQRPEVQQAQPEESPVASTQRPSRGLLH